jgi:hypothetical protein
MRNAVAYNGNIHFVYSRTIVIAFVLMCWKQCILMLCIAWLTSMLIVVTYISATRQNMISRPARLIVIWFRSDLWLSFVSSADCITLSECRTWLTVDYTRGEIHTYTYVCTYTTVLPVDMAMDNRICTYLTYPQRKLHK